MYDYGLIGNCEAAALVSRSGSIEWCCLPRPDSPPVFGKLLDPDGGEFSIQSVTEFSGRQQYIANTNVLETIITAEDGVYKITDFCPRFEQFGRMFRPNAIFRIVEPLEGTPQIKVACRPVNGWEKVAGIPLRGNTHLKYEMRGDFLRVLTSMPLTHFCEGSPFTLGETTYFALTWSYGLEDDLVRVAQDFLTRTIKYWHTWVKHCSIPSEFQKETIRSALTLKLHCYEDTGAILAALTTSLPEEIGSHRNWDYRFCWLRDSYFVLSAFHNLGHFEEMEGFLKFLLGIVSNHERLRPVYAIDQTPPLPETEHKAWRGFGGSNPVRSNNDAANHVQNDVYGELILALAPIYFDERFQRLRTPENEKLMLQLAERCGQSISVADAGLWELRGGWQEHTFTNLMCWAGLDRLARLKERGFFGNSSLPLADLKHRAEQSIRAAVVDGSLRNGPLDPTYDSALLQLPILRFPDLEVSQKTVRALETELRLGPERERGFLFRYRRQDDFGAPQSAFLICGFWLVQALARLGHIQEAKERLIECMYSANQVGLFSEHFIPRTRIQLGNFPQTYSHVGQINAAFAVSPPWNEVL